MPPQRLVLLLISAAFAAALGLAGCTASAHHESSGTSGTPQQASPSSTAASPPAPPSEPALRFGVSCDDFTAAIGLAPGSTVTTGARAVGTDVESAASYQDGFLTCTWSAGAPTANGYPTPNATLSISGDTAAGAASVSQGATIPGTSTAAGSLGVGTGSYEWCFPGAPGAPAACSAAAVTDTAWFWLQFVTDGTDAPKQQIEAAARGIVAVLGTARVAPAWSASAGAWDSATDCAALGAHTDFAAALGAPSAGSWKPWNGAGIEDPVELHAAYAGMYNCAWQADQQTADYRKSLIVVQILPRADWAWPKLAELSGVTSAALSVSGADGAYFRCSDEGGIHSRWGDALVDHAWVQVMDTHGTEQSEAAALLAAVVAGHTAS